VDLVGAVFGYNRLGKHCCDLDESKEGMAALSGIVVGDDVPTVYGDFA
jgi:hypothetical protein